MECDFRFALCIINLIWGFVTVKQASCRYLERLLAVAQDALQASVFYITQETLIALSLLAIGGRVVREGA
jgi:hypothetical protein